MKTANIEGAWTPEFRMALPVPNADEQAQMDAADFTALIRWEVQNGQLVRVELPESGKSQGKLADADADGVWTPILSVLGCVGVAVMHDREVFQQTVKGFITEQDAIQLTAFVLNSKPFSRGAVIEGKRAVFDTLGVDLNWTVVHRLDLSGNEPPFVTTQDHAGQPA